ncbi:MAG: histidine phosphatase family protein [Acidimicrobiales bacterium]
MRRFPQQLYRVPPGATELLLVRHGASEAAEEGRSFPMLGVHSDPPLAPEGREQAEAVCRRLAGLGIKSVVVSPLRRTAETAAPLLAMLGAQPVVEPDLREVHLGEWEGGLFRQKVADRDPVAVRMFTEERWDVIPGAESNEEVVRRVRAAVGRVVEGCSEQTVAVFTHGGVIATILAEATGARPFAFVGVDNASISRLVVDEGRWTVRGYNDIAHLGGPARSDELGQVSGGSDR